MFAFFVIWIHVQKMIRKCNKVWMEFPLTWMVHKNADKSVYHYKNYTAGTDLS